MYNVSHVPQVTYGSLDVCDFTLQLIYREIVFVIGKATRSQEYKSHFFWGDGAVLPTITCV